MKVCVDIQPAVAQRAGVGRFTKCLVEQLAVDCGDDELSLFYFDFKRNGLGFPVGGATTRPVQWVPGRYVQQAWRRLNWPPFDWFAGSADLYHFTNFIRPPLRKGRSIVTIYDASFLRFPEAAEPKNLAYLTSRIQDTADRADGVITISEFSAQEIHEWLGVPRDRIHVTYPGLDHQVRERPAPSAIAATRKTLGLDRPYLLFVSTMEPRKNIPFLVDLFDAADFFDGDLVLAGMKGWKVEPILEHIGRARRRDRIHYLEYVDDSALPALYAGAELFVFPSLYEGFGLPPLEAMMYGTPVVSSSGGSLPEVLGSAADVMPDFAMERWLESLRVNLEDSDRRSRMQEQGKVQARSYTWKEAAAKTWQAYRSLLT